MSSVHCRPAPLPPPCRRRPGQAVPAGQRRRRGQERDQGGLQVAPAPRERLRPRPGGRARGEGAATRQLCSRCSAPPALCCTWVRRPARPLLRTGRGRCHRAAARCCWSCARSGHTPSCLPALNARPSSCSTCRCPSSLMLCPAAVPLLPACRPSLHGCTREYLTPGDRPAVAPALCSSGLASAALGRKPPQADSAPQPG